MRYMISVDDGSGNNLYLGKENGDCCLCVFVKDAVYFDSLEEAKTGAAELTLVGCGCPGRREIGIISIKEVGVQDSTFQKRTV